MIFRIRPSISMTNGPKLRSEDRSPSSAVRLDYLDGIRGLTALYVALGHACALVLYVFNARHTQILTSFAGVPPVVLHTALALEQGEYAVTLFIVLSGYCLMLPVARSASKQLKGGAAGYLKRRARRILPPYYAALAFSLLLIGAVPPLRQLSSSWGSMAVPAFTRGVLLSHLLLLQNLNLLWWNKIDPPMWSVATEWQIYFVFPLVLLPVWRRFGTLAAAVAGIFLGVFLREALHQHVSDVAHLWFIGSFSLGMAGASISVSANRWETSLRGRAPWGILTAASLALLGLLANVSSISVNCPWLPGIISAFSAMGLLIWCTCKTSQGHPPLLLRIFNSRLAVSLGAFSYSLYLIHFPVLRLLDLAFRHLLFSPLDRLLALIFIAVPVSVLLSYIFHLFFERPFMAFPAPKTERQAEEAAIVSPAP